MAILIYFVYVFIGRQPDRDTRAHGGLVLVEFPFD